MTEYVTDVLYIRGEQNIIDDCLSRPTCSVTVYSCHLPAICESQKGDKEIKTYRN